MSIVATVAIVVIAFHVAAIERMLAAQAEHTNERPAARPLAAEPHAGALTLNTDSPLPARTTTMSAGASLGLPSRCTAPSGT